MTIKIKEKIVKKRTNQQKFFGGSKIEKALEIVAVDDTNKLVEYMNVSDNNETIK